MSLDQSLLELVEKGLITFQEAPKHCNNEVDFTLRYRGLRGEGPENLLEG